MLLDLFIMFLKKLKILSAKAGLRQNFKEIGRIYPKAALFYKTVLSPILFTSTIQYFYTDICHICDISQLCREPYNWLKRECGLVDLESVFNLFITEKI